MQKRGKGGDSGLEPIDSWLITQGMVRGHQLSRALVYPSASLCHLLSPCESDSLRPFSLGPGAKLSPPVSVQSLSATDVQPRNTSSGCVLQSMARGLQGVGHFQE